MSAKRWRELDSGQNASLPFLAVIVVLLTPAAIIFQYVLGGFVRHLNTMLTEHQIGAAIASVITITASVALIRSHDRRLGSTGKWMLFLLLTQVALGLATWVVKFGFQTIGYVAVPGSLSQLWIRSAHTVTAMLLLSAAVIAAAKVVVLIRAGRIPAWTETFSTPWQTTSVSTPKGGAA